MTHDISDDSSQLYHALLSLSIMLITEISNKEITMRISDI